MKPPLQVATHSLPGAALLTWRTPMMNARQWVRVQAGGGTFRLTVTTPPGRRENGEPFTTSAGTHPRTTKIPHNATAEEVQAALEALANVEPGDVEVTGDLNELTESSVLVEFTGQYAGVNVPQLLLTATLTDAEQEEVEIPGGQQREPSLIQMLYFQAQVWEGAFDTGVLLREDRGMSNALIHPAPDPSATYLMRVRTVAATETSEWASGDPVSGG